MNPRTIKTSLLAAVWMLAIGCAAAKPAPAVIRVGYFPNLTHAQALVGRATGAFQKALGPDVRIEWKAFNAGPAAIEALFADAIDMTYIGPNPAVAGYVRSDGRAVRVIAGATSGGASLVVRQGSGIRSSADLHGRKVASPQLANSQDVALRSWLEANGLQTRDRGGDVLVLPVSNAFQITLFKKGELDAAWSPEPWASRLVHEAGGKVLLDERSLWPGGVFSTTDLVAAPEFLSRHPNLVKRFLEAHIGLTDWICANPGAAKRILNEQLKRETGRALTPEELDDAFSRMRVTYDPLRSSVLKSAEEAFREGFLGKTRLDLSGLYDLRLLDEVLMEKKERPVS
ncbi:MAG: ABC transporter substrate-binding protein [Candidatus Acidiferrales bacterium]